MTLHDTIAADGINVFCNASDFAESVVYTKATGATRTINAVVVRDAWDEDGPLLEVHVANDATSGISSSEVKPDHETLTIAVRVGQTPTKRVIKHVMSHDEGMLVLECR